MGGILNSMKKLVACGMLLIAMAVNAAELNFALDTSGPGVGLFKAGTEMSFFLRMSATPYNPVTDGVNPYSAVNCVPLGTYQLNDGFVLPSQSFSLGVLAPKLTDGIDQYIQLFLVTSGNTMNREIKESVLFSTTSDLIGGGVVSSSFRINGIGTGTYVMNTPPAVEAVDMIDVSVDIVAIPEAATWSLLATMTSLGYAGFVRSRWRRQVG